MCQALGVAVDIVVEVARVGVEKRNLFLHGMHNARIAVADQRYVVVHVEKGAASVVVKILLPAADDLQRMLIRNAEIFPEQLAPCRKSFLRIRVLRRKAFGGNAEEQIGIGRKRSPDGALRCISNTRKIGATVEKIQDDLKVKMGYPAAVFVDVTDAGELLAARDALADLERVEGLSGEVAVEREEFQALTGRVAKNDEWAIIQGRGVDRNGVNDAIERGVNRRAWRGE